MTTMRSRTTANNEWVDRRFRLRAPALGSTTARASSRDSLFGRDGHLFYWIGDRGGKRNAQDLSNPLGKIRRVH